MEKQTENMSEEVKIYLECNFITYLPKTYCKDHSYKWPVILALHGMDERGDNLEKLSSNGLPKLIEDGLDLPFIVVCPQCPSNTVWTMEINNLKALLDRINHLYNTDEDRIYLTGYSLGGYGAWHLAEACPEKFAAMLPIASGANPINGFPERIKNIGQLPVWAFHGELDEIVEIKEAEVLIDVLKKQNENVKLTAYNNCGHESWERTYRDMSIYDWFLTKKKNERIN